MNQQLTVGTRISSADGIETITHADGRVTTRETPRSETGCRHNTVTDICSILMSSEQGQCSDCGNVVRRKWFPPLSNNLNWHWGLWH